MDAKRPAPTEEANGELQEAYDFFNREIFSEDASPVA